MSLLIYSHNITSRLKYVAEYVFKEKLKIPYHFTDSVEEFISYHKEKINYSSHAIQDSHFLQSDELLFKKGIQNIDLHVGTYLDMPVLFTHKNETSILPYDVFSAIFYYLSRYEEYLHFEADIHGRFSSKNSVSHQLDIIEIPIVDHWVKQIKAKIQEYFPNIELHQEYFKFIPTYDIDIAYSYKNKGLVRISGGFLVSLKRFNLKQFKDRFKVLVGKQKDPYDTFDWIKKLHQDFGLEPIFFFLVGDYGQFDRNISCDNPTFRRRILDISDHFETGVHPSYDSNKDIGILHEEIKTLSTITRREVTRSRQHYMRLHLPDSYNNLIDLGILKDYTMGYADAVGFRAGTSGSFFYYDLSNEVKTSLRVYPFSIMDVTLNVYQSLNKKEALEKCIRIYENIKEVEGLLITVWHNHTLCNQEHWTGWHNIYKNFMHHVLQDQITDEISD